MMRATGRKVRATGVTRLLYVLLALTVALTSLSVSATAADRVVGNPDGLQKAPEHGVNAIHGFNLFAFLRVMRRTKLYLNGGEDSPYKKEDIKRMSKANAEKWLAE